MNYVGGTVCPLPLTFLIFGINFIFRLVVNFIVTLKIIVEFLKLIYMGRIAASAIEAGGAAAVAGINARTAKRNTDATNAANLQIAREVNQANLDLARDQNRWNIEQREDERLYNSPEKQVERLKAAGMSSAAASQSVEGAGNTGSIVSADLANQQIGEPMQVPQTNWGNMIPSILGIMREYEQYRKDKSEANMVERDDALFHDEGMWTDLDLKKAQYRDTVDRLKQSWSEFPYHIDALKYTAESAKRLPAQADANLAKIKAEEQLLQQNFNLAKQNFSFLEKMNEKQLKEMDERVRNIIEDSGLKRSQSALARAMESKTTVEEENEKVKKAVNEIELVFKQNGAPDSVAQRVGILIKEGKLNNMDLLKVCDGIKDYLRMGKSVLMSPETRDFLNMVYDEGSSKISSLGVHSLGGLDELFYSLPWHSKKYKDSHKSQRGY